MRRLAARELTITCCDNSKGKGCGHDDKEEERSSNGKGWMDKSTEEESNYNQPLMEAVKACSGWCQ